MRSAAFGRMSNGAARRCPLVIGPLVWPVPVLVVSWTTADAGFTARTGRGGRGRAHGRDDMGPSCGRSVERLGMGLVGAGQP